MIDTLLLSLLSFYSASQGASFDSAKTPVARGLAHYWNGEYELTVEALAPSCPEESDLGERLECYQYLAFSWVALGEEDRAQEAFVELLSSDPAFRIAPELVAPKILKRFDDATHRLATEWFGQAKELYLGEEFEQAIALFDRVLVLDSSHELAREYRQLAGERLELSARLTEMRSSDRAPVEPPDPERVYHWTSEITRPVLIRRVEPEYPRTALLRKTEGQVVVALVIHHSGEVREPKVIRSLDEAVDRAAVNAVKQWRYQPATLDGRPVSVHAVVQIAFDLP